MPCTADALARARRLTRRLLHGWGLTDEYTCRAEAVVAELGRERLIVASLASRWGTSRRRDRHEYVHWAQIAPDY